MGGDFRFHGHWLEAATGLYHMRARDYDPVTGLFLERDPAEGQIEEPETFHPYMFARNNPYWYSDPTGAFTMVEINISISIQGDSRALSNALLHQAKDHVVDETKSLIGRFITNMLSDFIVGSSGFDKLMNGTAGRGDWLDRIRQGNAFGFAVMQLVCNQLPDFTKYIVAEPWLRPNGRPFGGLECGDISDERSLNVGGPHPRADFIASEHKFSDLLTTRSKKTFLIAEVKRSLKALESQSTRQRSAVINHATTFEYAPLVLIVAYSGSEGEALRVLDDYVAHGTLPVLVTLTGGRSSKW